MKKQVISFLMTIAVVTSFCAPSALAAPAISPTFQQPRIELALGGDSLFKRAFLIKDNGEFWGYSIYENKCQCLATSVVSFVILNDNTVYLLFRDGSLWAFEFPSMSITIIKKTKIATEVSQLREIYHDQDGIAIGYLKEDGSLYSAYPRGGPVGTLEATNVLRFADANAYITRDHILHYSTQSGFKSMNGFSDVYVPRRSTYYALSDNGDLYAWGYNSHGDVGCGSGYDYSDDILLGVGGGPDEGITGIGIYISDPSKILENVQSIYAFKERYYGIYAIDNNGQMWKWGDDPIGARVPYKNGEFSKGDIIKPGVQYCYPRPVETIAQPFEYVNSIKIAPDGTLSLLTFGDKSEYTCIQPQWRDVLKKNGEEIGANRIDETTGMTDVDVKAYYYDGVQWAISKGIAHGTSKSRFSPAAPCTRAQVVTFLWRAAGSPVPTGTASFADVPADAYYRDAVLWAVETGITNGTGADAFSPNATVDRAQTVTFLYRYAGSPAASGGGFDDVDSGSYYADAVAWAVSQEITNGTSPTTFAPASNCTRGQTVTFLFRALAQ